MSDFFLGEIRLFAGNFAPRGWALCDGSLLSIASNQALFALLGVNFGGDGRTTFGLPDLRGRMIQGGTGAEVGARGGRETIPLMQQNLPPHNHYVHPASGTATSNSPSDNVLAPVSAGSEIYQPTDGGGIGALTPCIVESGKGQPHLNMQPSLVLTYIIATTGLFPPRT